MEETAEGSKSVVDTESTTKALPFKNPNFVVRLLLQVSFTFIKFIL